MSNLWKVNNYLFVYANNEKEIINFLKEERVIEEDINIEKIDNDTKLYLFTDENGEELWFWYPSDNATKIVETNVGEFFSEYCDGVKLPVVVYSQDNDSIEKIL
jgi:hypothetical protein